MKNLCPGCQEAFEGNKCPGCGYKSMADHHIDHHIAKVHHKPGRGGPGGGSRAGGMEKPKHKEGGGPANEGYEGGY